MNSTFKDDAGTEALRRYFQPYAELESPTWRASPRWAAEIGYRSRSSTR